MFLIDSREARDNSGYNSFHLWIPHMVQNTRQCFVDDEEDADLERQDETGDVDTNRDLSNHPSEEDWSSATIEFAEDKSEAGYALFPGQSTDDWYSTCTPDNGGDILAQFRSRLASPDRVMPMAGLLAGQISDNRQIDRQRKVPTKKRLSRIFRAIRHNLSWKICRA